MKELNELLNRINNSSESVREVNSLLRDIDSHFDEESENYDEEQGELKLNAVRTYLVGKYVSEDRSITPYDESNLDYLAQQEEKHLGALHKATTDLQEKDEFESY